MSIALALLAAAPTEIVVTGTGLPDTPAAPAYDRVVLDREVLDRAASGRIEDALANVAGFQQFRRSDSRSSNPSAQGVTLRALGGNATSRALVTLDGVPLADPFFGYVPLSATDPAQLARAVVTRGGGSGAFGAGAVAGTIALESAGAATLGPVGGQALVDDRGETALAGYLAPRLGHGYAVLAGRWDRGQGFWTSPPDQRVPASVRARFDSWSASARMAAPLGDAAELQARVGAFGDARTLRFAGADTTSSGSDASVRLIGRGAFGFELLGYVQTRDFSNVVISSSSFRKTLDQQGTPSTGLGGKLELRPPVGGAHVLRIGADWRRATGMTQEAAYSTVTGLVTARRRAGGRNDDVGLYVEDDWTHGDLTLTGGARADRWVVADGFYREVAASGTVTGDIRYAARAGWTGSLRGGARLRLSPALSLRGAAYSGLRLPTLNELYRPFVVFPVTTQANAALANERLRGAELGAEIAPVPGVSLALTAFDNRLGGAIANVTLAPGLRQRRNVDAIRARGIEASAGLRRGAVALDGSLAWTDARVEATGASAALDGMRPAQTPTWATSLTGSVAPCGGCSAALTLRHVGAQFEDDLETDVLPAATTLDAIVALPVARHWSLLLRGENLTGARVVTRNQGGSIDLGAPRTLWLGVKLRG
ncbi:TonB-dependent receptor [Parablastomonas sp. CN1-191]|uniref:TonB-dependent receptor n=1 Tax=Parablastomonas sp. CN1-191 TaxID=3400908 RepID=UPI003BF86F73